MSNIINFLLAEQPVEADVAILAFLEAKKSGMPSPHFHSKPGARKGSKDKESSRQAILRDRLYMARKVQPVLEHLMRRVVEEQPQDVAAHFIEQLTDAISEKAEGGASAAVEDDEKLLFGSSPPRQAKNAPTPAAKPAASPPLPSLAPLPAPPSQGACDALFRMLDEDGAGFLTAVQVVGRLAGLRACGVPLDATAQSFWSSVELRTADGESGGAETSFDRARFFGTMGRVCASAAAWLGPGLPRPALSSVVVAAPALAVHKKTPVSTPAAVSPAAAAAPSAAPAALAPALPPAAAPAPASSASVLAEGAPVSVNYRKSGNYYPGKVGAVNADGTYDIVYDDGDSEAKVKASNVLGLGADGQPLPVVMAAAPVVAAPSSATATATSAASDLKTAKVSVKPVVAIVGVSGAGKSVLLKAMSGDPDPKPRPTTGFSQKRLGFELPGFGSELSVHWYDLPGSWGGKWDEYLGECHAVVYVVDAAADAEGADVVDAKGKTTKSFGFDDAARVFKDVSQRPHVRGKPMLVLANKQDLEGSCRSAGAVADALGLSPDAAAAASGNDRGLSSVRVVGCCAHPLRHASNGEFDARVEGGLEWLLGSVANRFDELGARVDAAATEAEALRAAEKVERARRVFTKVLKEKAFPSDPSEVLETFSEVDGFEFLAMELLVHDPQEESRTRTADEQWGLPEVAQKVARLVGFQKMAMIMVADMINPEHKKNKTTRSWDEVVAFVKDRREDAGLTREL